MTARLPPSSQIQPRRAPALVAHPARQTAGRCAAHCTCRGRADATVCNVRVPVCQLNGGATRQRRCLAPLLSLQLVKPSLPLGKLCVKVKADLLQRIGACLGQRARRVVCPLLGSPPCEHGVVTVTGTDVRVAVPCDILLEQRELPVPVVHRV